MHLAILNFINSQTRLSSFIIKNNLHTFDNLLGNKPLWTSILTLPMHMATI